MLVMLDSEYTSVTVDYCHQKLRLKSLIGPEYASACIEFGNSLMKLVKYVMKKLKRMARNMFRLFPGIAVQKFS